MNETNSREHRNLDSSQTAASDRQTTRLTEQPLFKQQHDAPTARRVLIQRNARLFEQAGASSRRRLRSQSNREQPQQTLSPLCVRVLLGTRKTAGRVAASVYPSQLADYANKFLQCRVNSFSYPLFAPAPVFQQRASNALSNQAESTSRTANVVFELFTRSESIFEGAKAAAYRRRRCKPRLTASQPCARSR